MPTICGTFCQSLNVSFQSYSLLTFPGETPPLSRAHLTDQDAPVPSNTHTARPNLSTSCHCWKFDGKPARKLSNLNKALR